MAARMLCNIGVENKSGIEKVQLEWPLHNHALTATFVALIPYNTFLGRRENQAANWYQRLAVTWVQADHSMPILQHQLRRGILGKAQLSFAPADVISLYPEGDRSSQHKS